HSGRSFYEKMRGVRPAFPPAGKNARKFHSIAAWRTPPALRSEMLFRLLVEAVETRGAKVARRERMAAGRGGSGDFLGVLIGVEFVRELLIVAIGTRARGPPDALFHIFQLDEEVGLAAQLVGDHRWLRFDRADDADAHALTLDRFDETAEIAITGEQDRMVDIFRKLHHVDGELDVHITLVFAPPGGIGELLGRLGDHGIAIVIEPVDEGADRRIFLIL